MSDQYHKARKQYALFSGIVIVWVLVGIRVNTENPIESVGVSLLSPEAIPVMLLTILVYFAYRTTIEWFQCDTDRRNTTASKIDFSMAHLIGASAFGIYIV
jgi:hypothetical protein